MASPLITLEDIRQARSAVSRTCHLTPLFPSRTFSEMTGAQVLLKAENLQRTGSFKIRGAFHRLSLLTPAEKRRGVVAASAGNHAQGVALAAQLLGMRATIIMPEHASIPKVEATRGYGAQVVLHGDSYDEAYAHAAALAREKGLTLIHAFDDEAIIAGQGSIGLELLEQAPDMEAVIVPVGGGGLIAGIAMAVKGVKPSVQVLGIQAKAATAVAQAFHGSRARSVPPSPTIADGIAVGRPGRVTLPIVRNWVDDIAVVDEEEIAQAMVLLLERSKLVVEGAGAVGLAALISGKLKLPGKRVAVVLSGGNADPSVISRALEHGLAHAGRYLVLSVTIPDRPGQLARLLGILADEGANVLEVMHYRAGRLHPIGLVEVQVVAETRDSQHANEICEKIRRAGLPMHRLRSSSRI